MQDEFAPFLPSLRMAHDPGEEINKSVGCESASGASSVLLAPNLLIPTGDIYGFSGYFHSDHLVGLVTCVVSRVLPPPSSCQVYPVGIPVLYATILWKNRKLLNPRLHTTPDEATRAEPDRRDDMPSTILCITPKGQARSSYSYEELQELQAKVEARREHPKLVPSMFLWKDFGENVNAVGT